MYYGLLTVQKQIQKENCQETGQTVCLCNLMQSLACLANTLQRTFSMEAVMVGFYNICVCSELTW